MSRQTRRHSERRALARGPKRRGRLGFPLVMIALVAVGGTAIWLTRQETRQPAEKPAGVQEFDAEALARDHVDQPVEYEQTPPVGGAHFQVWQNCGYYDDPITSETAVHSMEHGAVWIVFEPDLSDDDRGVLRGLASPNFVLVSQWAGEDLPSPVVASAWGVQLELDSVDDPRLEQFVDYYAAGPQTPEAGASCAGGVGEPSA